jgi:hypothetical protein
MPNLFELYTQMTVSTEREGLERGKEGRKGKVNRVGDPSPALPARGREQEGALRFCPAKVRGSREGATQD